MRKRVHWLFVGGALVAAYFVAARLGWDPFRQDPWRGWRPTAETFNRFAGSESCRECHVEQFAQWKPSHHGQAERGVDLAVDREAFDPKQEIRHGSGQSEATLEGGRPVLVTEGKEGRRPYDCDRVLGVDPLRQFLVPAAGGRYQMTELAFDPKKKDWFDVFGGEDRRTGEWGHWSGRGMTWNSMCAECHNTDLRKNYDPASDSYDTKIGRAHV